MAKRHIDYEHDRDTPPKIDADPEAALKARMETGPGEDDPRREPERKRERGDEEAAVAVYSVPAQMEDRGRESPDLENSKGTKDMVKQASKAGIAVYHFRRVPILQPKPLKPLDVKGVRKGLEQITSDVGKLFP